MILLNKTIIIKPDIAEKFRDFMKNGRILLIAAPCGFGKTTITKELLKNCRERVREVNAEDADFSELANDTSYDILVIDDLQMIQNAEDYQTLCNIIRNHAQKRFILLTRGMIPGALIPFRISGLLTEIEEGELFFDKETVLNFLKEYGVQLSDLQINSVMNLVWGYPIAVEMFANHMARGAEYNEKLAQDIRFELYTYYDEMVFNRFDLQVRRFLLELAPFESFDIELAKMVSGDSEAGKIISSIQKNTRMMKVDGAEHFYFWQIFREFLMWEQNRAYTSKQQRALYSRAGLYYELHRNYAKALEFYSKSEEQAKVSELIIKAMQLHPGMGHYEELSEYFVSLPNEMIKESPALMQGKSMLCALHADYEGSEKWYDSLKNFAQVRKYSDAAAKEARSRLTWLDIALPQRGVSGMVNTIIKAFKMMLNKEIKLPPFSVTSTLPSIMNGGKDFSEWSKKDDLLYKTIKAPVVGVLGKDGVGLPDCAIAESKFEKGEDISGRMFSLVSKLSEVQNDGTPDIEFALAGLLVRSQVDAGRIDDARRSLETLKERFQKNERDRFIPNIEAMLCRIALRCDDMNYADEWYRNKAPRDSLKFMVMKRYQYFTEAMAELAFGDNDGALLTLSPLRPYCEKCSRYIDKIHLNILAAIAKYRKNDEAWKADLKEAIRGGEEYGFVRTISVYGSAVLPLLGEFSSEETSDFIKKATKYARTQAIYYPDFLKPKNSSLEKLTETELQVLRLICADKSNSEIGDILDIRLATVKSHVSHILQKLGVSRRSEAKTTAQKLHII